MKVSLLAFLMVILLSSARAQNPVFGKVLDQESSQPLAGATIKINKQHEFSTDRLGHFNFSSVLKEIKITVSYVGYNSFELTALLPIKDSLIVRLKRNSNELKEVVVSTGYQNIPKERATGSFEKINADQLDRRVSTDVISKLEDQIPGLVFNRATSNAGYQTQISIRGQSTILGKADPLIVIDNFPYDGDINNINPNDVESVTILKDAAAASIWGAKAGNGVIVITTKKGRFNQAPKVSFNSSVTVGERPNLFYQSRMSSAEYINEEEALFAKGFYNSAERSANKTPLTPVVELLIEQRDGKISSVDASAQIDAFKNQDVRNDFEKYLYQKSIQQQYNVNVSGGSDKQRYYVSAGYDKNAASLVSNGYNRLTFNANNTYNFIHNHLDVTTGISYIQSDNINNNPGTTGILLSSLNGTALYPYAKLSDGAGNPLPITHDYRTSFLNTAQQNGLLNWQYSPLEEIRLADNHAKQTDYRLNFNLVYKVIPGLSVSALYYYGRTEGKTRNYQSQDTYYTRNLINQFTQTNPDGTLSYMVPLGGILDQSVSTAVSQDFRGQVNYAKNWNSKSDLTAIAGYEIRNTHTISDRHREYGYDDEHATSTRVDYISYFNRYYIPASTQQIPYVDSQGDLTDNYISYYANAAYNYDSRYTVSGSARIDESNLFGVKANQKGVPLWSAGIAWNASNESFYHVNWLSLLKLRATYGYNGNVNKSVTAYTTAVYFNGSDNLSGLPYATISNPPNPYLQWERVKVINLGIDFEALNHRLNGSLEYYHKNGIDLIGSAPYQASTGIIQFQGNLADNSGHGIDLALHSRNLDGQFTWSTDFIFSNVTDKVTRYDVKTDALSFLEILYPLAGRPLYGIYSFKWAGLDPQTGEAQGYLNGQVSKDYTAIINASTPDNIVYNGPARPTIFGSLRNTFSFKGFSISGNISYRLGYYFRRNSVNYQTVLSGQGGSGDFGLRWQNPGDEAFTQIPSLPVSNNGNRNNFYMYSSALVEKADNIRLQDINLSYTLTKEKLHRLPFSAVQIYLYANNLAILWKATKTGLDPDYPLSQFPPMKTYAIGLKADF